MEAKLKHLELIQGVINRLAGESARLKNWSVTLVAALFVLLARADRTGYIHVVFVPVLAFWILDGYFLCQERLFRALYEHVCLLKFTEIDFWLGWLVLLCGILSADLSGDSCNGATSILRLPLQVRQLAHSAGAKHWQH